MVKKNCKWFVGHAHELNYIGPVPCITSINLLTVILRPTFVCVCVCVTVKIIIKNLIVFVFFQRRNVLVFWRSRDLPHEKAKEVMKTMRNSL